MRHYVRVHIFLVLAVILLALALAPVAAAKRPVVLAGAGTGEGFSSSTVEVRVHFNSNAGGEVWVNMWFPDMPERNGAFRASIDTDVAQANETAFVSVATVVSSDNPTFWVGRPFLFFVGRANEGFYVLTADWLPWFLDRGNFTIRS